MNSNELDFKKIIAANKTFESRTDTTPLTREDLRKLAMLAELGMETDEDGDSRGYAATRIIALGDVNAARTIHFFADMCERKDEQFLIFDLWRYGTDAGVIESGRDYAATEEDIRYFGRLREFFTVAGWEYPLTEVSKEDFRTLASFFATTDGEMDMEEFAEYVIERGAIQAGAFEHYLAAYPALREGTL